MSMGIQQQEVVWYRSNGRYPRERIVNDNTGRAYVIGDWSWKRLHPDKPEEIELAMEFARRAAARTGADHER